MRIHVGRGVLLVLLLTAAGLLAAGCGNSGDKTDSNRDQVPRVKVSIETVRPAPMRDVLVLPGSTEAFRDVLLAADWGGRVEWVCGCEGQRVKKGRMIAKIDVAILKAMLDRARAAFKLADEAAKRRQALRRKKVIPQEDLDRAITERLVAQGNLAEARVRYQQSFVRAPIDAVVNRVHVEVGEFVDRGQPVAELVNPDPIRVVVSVPEMDVRYIKVGDRALVTIDAYPGRKIIGAVDLVSYKADPATKTFAVRVVIANSDLAIRPGMIARVYFQRRLIPDALSVPLHAIVDKGGDRLVFVVVDGVVHARAIKIGVIQQDRVQITRGLKPGDQLIVVGQHEVEEGMRVSVQ